MSRPSLAECLLAPMMMALPGNRDSRISPAIGSFAITGRRVSRFTPFYMALIDPFRKLIVYPSLLRSVRARWNQAFGSN